MTTRPRIERIDVKLPAGFDPAKHVESLTRKIVEVHGSGWEIDNVNLGANTATASRNVTVNEVTASASNADSIEVRLRRDTKPADGDKMAAKLESQHEGYMLTTFEPFLGYAILTKLSNDTARARGAIAVALGVKPWDIQINESIDGGFDFSLPRSYVPSKHYDKLQEVAEAVVGVDGWYVVADAQKLTARIVPSDPPTFPGTVPYPFRQKIPAMNPSRVDWASIPLGIKLGQAQEPGEQLCIDLSASAHCQVSGISGGGKTVGVNALIFGLLARGYELAIVDVKHKAVDFEWARELVRDGGWGCESISAGVTTLALVIAEGERRAKLIKQYGVQKWQELPASLGVRPVAVVLDEVTALFMMEEVPKGLPKDNSLVVEANQANLEKAVLRKYVSKIAAEWRFAGIHILLATQMAQNNTGIPPTIKINLGNRVLFGANPPDASRLHAFMDARAVPKVPSNIQIDASANRGVGAAELEGQGSPSVFKAYFATTEDYRKQLRARNTPITRRPEPTAAEVAKHSPSLMDEDEPASRMRPEVGGFKDSPRPQSDHGLTGAAAAGHELKVAAALAAKADAERAADASADFS
jgi:hypothetical protein